MTRIERIARLFPLLMNRLGRLRALVHEGHDLTHNQYKTLLTVADAGCCSLGDLARDLGVATSSASQMVDRLVGQGLVLRTPVADNRRQVEIRLTEAGSILLTELQAAIVAGYGRLLVRLPDAEQEDLVQSFETIARILGKLT